MLSKRIFDLEKNELALVTWHKSSANNANVEI